VLPPTHAKQVPVLARYRHIVRLTAGLGLLAILSGCGQTPLPRTAPKPPVEAVRTATPFDVNGEVSRLRAALEREVLVRLADTPDSERVWITRTRAMLKASDFTISRPQLIVVVDRNPDVEELRIVLAQPQANWQSLGGTKVSTGQTGRYDYYITPTGVFLHTDAILDWRAEGTYNAQHIRGLGVTGMRVWDFGWQTARKGWGTGETAEIRLLLHATDPDYLERRLGHTASKGCVRIPAAMNRFLDRHGVLDADYERAAKDDPRFAALLLADRTPTPLAGDALVIIDTSEPLPVEKRGSALSERTQSMTTRSNSGLGAAEAGTPMAGCS
jgi:hypothetical protein